MPHVIIEYSANVSDMLDVDALMDTVYAAARTIEAFPLGGLRVRAAPRTHYRIADNDLGNGFIHVTARIGAGRDAATKSAIADTLFAAVKVGAAAAFEHYPLAISFELAEVDALTSRKHNNLHRRLKDRP